MSERRRRSRRHSGAHSEDSRRAAKQPTAEPKSGLGALIREIVTVGAIALFISFLIKTFFAQAFWIPSGSMEETLVYGDRVIVSKIQAGPLSVDRGDIVVFEDPANWLPPAVEVDRGPVMSSVVNALEFVGLAPMGEGNHLIKRVIGVGGDNVRCCNDDGQVEVNGAPLAEEEYLFPGNEPSKMPFDITVPAESFWVMGDHREISGDSRVHDDGTGAQGSIPQDRIVGQAVALVWPLTRFDWFQNPQALNDRVSVTSADQR